MLSSISIPYVLCIWKVKISLIDKPPVITDKPPFIIPAVVIILLALALTLIPWHKKSSLDSIYRSSAQDIQTSLGVTLSENPDFVSKLSIPNQDPTGFNVYTTGNEDFGVIYYNGEHILKDISLI